MSKKLKIAVVVSAAVVSLVAVAVAVSLITSSSSAKQAADEMRKDMKTDFRKNLSQYEDMLTILSDGFDYPEYCIILNGGEPTVDVNYENISVGDEQVSQQLKEFAKSTGTEVIYVDAEAVYFKREFKSGIGKTSEANFLIRYDEAKPDYETSQKLAGAWYYTEFEIE